MIAFRTTRKTTLTARKAMSSRRTRRSMPSARRSCSNAARVSGEISRASRLKWVGQTREFEAAASAALAAARAEDCQAVLDAFPLDLLPEDRFEDWTDEHRRRLDGLRAAVEETLAGALVDAGRAEEAVRLLSPLRGGDSASIAGQCSVAAAG